MQEIMQNYCPVYRSGKLMKEGKNKLNYLIDEFKNIKISDKSTIWNTEIIEAYELQNLLLQSMASIDSALNRKESRGAHARMDYQKRDDKKWMKHTMISVNTEGNSEINYRSVNLKTNTKEIKTIEPKARVY